MHIVFSVIIRCKYSALILASYYLFRFCWKLGLDINGSDGAGMHANIHSLSKTPFQGMAMVKSVLKRCQISPSVGFTDSMIGFIPVNVFRSCRMGELGYFVWSNER